MMEERNEFEETEEIEAEKAREAAREATEQQQPEDKRGGNKQGKNPNQYTVKSPDKENKRNNGR